MSALVVDESGTLYAGQGNTFLNGGRNRVATWDGIAWSTLGTDMDDPVVALTLDGSGNLYAGGLFTIAGSQASGHAARFDLPPNVVLSTTATEPTSVSPVVVTVTSSETISGLDANDFVVTNGSAGGLAVVTTGRVWTVDITPAAAGAVTVSLPADAVQALSDGNGNYASNTLSRTYNGGPDVTAPVVSSITRSDATPTNADTLSFTVAFSEGVTGVDAEDFGLATSGVAATVGTVTGSGSTYNVDVTGITGDGTLRLDILDGAVISDLASNPLVGPYTVGEAYDIDNTPPDAPTVSAAAGSTTDKTPTWTWTPGTNAGSGTYRHQLDAQLGGGWVETTDTTFTPAADLADGEHTLYVAERDAAGNWSAAGSFTVTVTTASTGEEQEPPSGCGCGGAGAGGGAGIWLLAALLARRRTGGRRSGHRG